MKNKFKRLVVGSMVGILTLATAFGSVGCVNTGVTNATTEIEIAYLKSGIGQEWLDLAAEKFTEKYPEYNVVITPTVDSSYFSTTIKLPAQDNTVDLYALPIGDYAYTQYLEPLDDILNYQHEDESKTIGDKLDQSVLKGMEQTDGSHYGISFSGGILSIAYNKELIPEDQVPRTTDELKDLTFRLEKDLKSIGAKPFITFSNGGYWYMIYESWFAQYNGLDYYYDTWLKLDDGSGDYGKALLLDQDKKTGRYQVLELLETLFSPNYVVAGSSSAEFTVQQTKFLKRKAAAMMPTGTWLFNEMKTTLADDKDAQFGFMKVPVLSAIIDNLPTVEDDFELSALVEAVDAVGADKTKLALTGEGYDVSQADADRVYEARNIVTSVNDENTFMIPKTSNAKEATKKFLKFMYSDEMIRMFMNTTHLNFAATPSDGQVDLSSWSGFEKDVFKLNQESIKIPKYKVQSKVLAEARIYGDASVYGKFAATDPKDRWSVDQMWSYLQTYYSENWNTFLYNAGYGK